MQRMYLVDPFNEKHLEMIKCFEEEHEKVGVISTKLGDLCTTHTKTTYLEEKKEKNEIEEYLFIEQNTKVIDICHVQGEKDIKTGKITTPIFLPKQRRKIILFATDYLLQTLGLEEVFIEVNPNDKKIIDFLSKEGYENLGEEQRKIIFLKEKVEEKEYQRMIA